MTRQRLRAAGAALGALLLVLAVVGVAAGQTGGSELVDESFATGAVFDTNFGVQGFTCLTGRAIGAPLPPGAANIPDCAASRAGPVPPPGRLPGYLQFTDATTNKTGSILYNRPIPSTAGVIATFDQWQYGGTEADGIAFFLVDGATQLTQPGGFGGSLGYAQRTGVPGIKGGYVGVGFDVFGNFYNDREGRGRNCPPNQQPPVPNPPLVKNSIVVRGSGNENDGYCYLGSTTPQNPPQAISNLPGSLQGSSLATGRRRITLTVSPAPAPRVTVTVDFIDGNGAQQVLDVPAPPNPPSTYKFGWTASTGSQTDVHLIQNVVVKTVNPLDQLNLSKQVDKTNLPNPLVLGSVVPYQFVVTNSGLETLTNLRITDPRVTSASCPSTVIDPVPASTSTVVCAGNYVVTQADVDAGEIVNTAFASAVNPAGGAVRSNDSSVTLVVGSSPRITIDKLVLTPPPYTFGSVITYRYDVANTGTVTVRNPVITDDKVGGIVCQPPLTLLPQPQYPSSTFCTGTYTVRAADLDPNGFLTNTATASATPAAGGTVVSAPDSLTLPVGVDIGVTKSVNEPMPKVGQVVTFTITATNTGPANATSVVIDDPVGPGVRFVGAIAPPGTTFDPFTGRWTVGNLSVGQTLQLQLSLQVVGVDPYVNVATLSAVLEPDINPNNDRGEATITPIRDADVGMAKTVDDATPAVGQTITYAVTATNRGPSPATGVVVSDPLPAGLALSSSTPSQGAYDPGTGIWTVGSLAVGGSATLTITALVTADGTITNTATKTAQDQPDPNPDDDQASVTITASLVADLSITKRSGLSAVLAGSPIAYTITVANAGPSDVAGATVTDTFPPELTNVTWSCIGDLRATCGSASGTGNIATTVTIPAGRFVVITVMGTVAPDAAGTLTNTAAVMPPAGTTDPNPDNDRDTDMTAILAEADLVASKLGPALPVTAGTPVTFIVGVINDGPSTATDVVLTDPLPPGLTFVSNTGDCVSNYPCTIGTLAPGASASITSTYAVPPGYTAPDPIVNTVTASSATPDPVPGNNTATARASLSAPSADLAVTKSNGVTQVVAGRSTTYIIVVTNRGPSDVTGVQVVDMVPPILQSVEWTCTGAGGGTCAAASGTGSIATTVSLPLNATATFELSGTVAPDAQGQLVNTVRATNPPGFGDPSEATATDTDDIVSLADLAIVKTGPATVVPGNQIVYTLVVTNNQGGSTARNVVVTDQTPPGLTFVSTTGDCTTAFPCALGAMAPGATRTITVTVAVPEGYAAPNPIVNEARVSSDTPDPDLGNNVSTWQTQVNRSADVRVAKTVSPPAALVGDTVTFTVEASNAGPNVATGVVVSDLLPPGVVLTQASASQGVYLASPAGQWSVGRLGVGDPPARLTLTAVVTAPGAITNVATKTAANEPDPDTSNDTASATLNGGALADVGVVKLVNDAMPALGAAVTFTVRVTNFGPSAATGIVVEDALPADLRLVSAVPSQGGYDDATGLWSAGDLAVGASATLTLEATVLAPTVQVNSATKTAQGEPDPNPANDRSSVTISGAGTADVAIAKAISNPAPAVGELLSFTVTATNLGPEAATGVVVTDALPAALELVAALPAAAWNTATGQWTVGTLQPSQSQVLVLIVRAIQPGAFTNTATKTAQDQPDPNPGNDSGSASGVAGLVADLSVTKTDGLTRVVAGGDVTWTIVVENAGPSPVTDARVTDVFPGIVGSVTWTCTPEPSALCAPLSPDNPSGAASGAGDVDLPIQFLPPGGRVVIEVNAEVSPDAVGTLSNTAEVLPPAGVTDPDLDNNRATDTTAIDVEANLQVLKTGPPTAVSGQTIVYQIFVINAGPSTATDVVLTDPTPPDLLFVLNAVDCTTPFPCALGSLAPGESRTVASVYAVLPGAGLPRVVVNTATASSPTPDPNPDDSRSSVETAIPASADLGIVKEPVAAARVGAPLVYRLQVTNRGLDAALDVVVTDTLPPGMELVAATSTQGGCSGTTTISCALGAVPARAGATVTVTVIPRAAGTAVNTATVASVTPDPNPADNTSTISTVVSQESLLSLSKTVAPAAPAVGDTLTYTLVTTNRGAVTATNVVLVDQLPAEVTPGTATATAGTCTLANRTVTCALGDLAPAASATVTITAVRDSPGAFANVATVTATEYPDGSNATAATPSTASEICDNCVDDDGDGQTDQGDPDCCPQIGTLTVTSVRGIPSGGDASRGRLRIAGTLAGASFADLDPRSQQVSLLVGDGTLLACCTIPESKWMRLYRKHFGFWDQKARVCPPIVDVALRQTSAGGGFNILGRRVDLGLLDPPDLTVTLRIGDSCASNTVTLRRKKSGALVFP